MKFSLSDFTEFLCELQRQKAFSLQSVFKLLEKYYGISRLMLVKKATGTEKRTSGDLPLQYICRNIDDTLVENLFTHAGADPFERIMPPGMFLKKELISFHERKEEGYEDGGEYEKFLKAAGAQDEVCLYLQRKGEYLAAFSVFLEQPLSEGEKDILIHTGKCVTEMYFTDQKNRATKKRFFHEFFDGVKIGAAILNQDMEIIDMNETFSDFCKIIVRHGSIDTDSVKASFQMNRREKNYAQSVINHLGANIITKPERIKIDCLLYNYRIYSKPVVFYERSGKLHTATCVYLTEYKKICNQWLIATIDTLTPREKEILTMMAYGYDNHEIEEKCFISQNTIKTHQRNIYQKFNVASRSELISKLYLMNYRHK